MSTTPPLQPAPQPAPLPNPASKGLSKGWLAVPLVAIIAAATAIALFLLQGGTASALRKAPTVQSVIDVSALGESVTIVPTAKRPLIVSDNHLISRVTTVHGDVLISRAVTVHGADPAQPAADAPTWMAALPSDAPACTLGDASLECGTVTLAVDTGRRQNIVAVSATESGAGADSDSGSDPATGGGAPAQSGAPAAPSTPVGEADASSPPALDGVIAPVPWQDFADEEGITGDFAPRDPDTT